MDVMTSYGINACPPLLVGVGVATSVETAALLSKKALMRPLGSHNENERTATMEKLLEDDKFEMVSVGPTTSMRMEKFEYEFVQKSGVRVIVGKGGMGPNTERACKEFGAIHCVFPAGNAVVAATEVEEIVEAQWRDLGMPETLWHCHVNEFGPLIVSIDAEGRNLFEENKVIFNQRKDKAVEEICKHVGFIK